MTVALIWAQARDGVIGSGGGLPWHLPEDLKLFRAMTTGSTVVMGRRTWESLPERFRPLPGRTNVVLTSDPDWSAAGASRADGVGEVLGEHCVPGVLEEHCVPGVLEEHCVPGVLEEHPSLWVIGGGAVYAAFLPHADRLVVTDVDVLVEGDTWAPVIGPEWKRVTRTPDEGWSVSSSGLRYAVSEYVRDPVGSAG